MVDLKSCDSGLSLPPLRAGAATGPTLPARHSSAILARGALVALALVGSTLILSLTTKPVIPTREAGKLHASTRIAPRPSPASALMAAATDIPVAN